MEETNYDLILIGSGMSSLSVGSIMSQLFGKKVLILEQHFQLGGFTHSFKRGKFKWDVGLHYVGRMIGGEFPKVMMDFITCGKLKWHRIPDPFEAFFYPTMQFKVHGEPKRYIRDIVSKFPDEKKAIRRYFRDINWVTFWFRLYFLARCLPRFLEVPVGFIARLTDRIPTMTTLEYINRHFKNPELGSLIASQWGSYGLPPSSSSFLIHAIVITHFIKGGYYPDGGSDQIAATIVPVIEAHGGACLTNHRVTEVIIENGTAVGVKATVNEGDTWSEKRFYAKQIVSGIGVYNTFHRIIPPHIPVPFRKTLEQMTETSTVVTVYLGLKSGADKALGIGGEHFWIYDSFDHDSNFRNKDLLNGRPSSCYLSFPSLRDPNDDRHTAVILASVDYKEFEQWNGKQWRKRDKAYYKTKDIITDGLIAFIERRIPGFSRLITYREMGTPLSNEYFTLHQRGAMYGLAASPFRYRQKWLRPETPIRNFYLTGADICALGIVSAMMAGLETAGKLGSPLGVLNLIPRIRIAVRRRKKERPPEHA